MLFAPGQEYEKYADRIKEMLLKISMIERWGWTLKEIKEAEEEDSEDFEACKKLLMGIAQGEDPKKKC